MTAEMVMELGWWLVPAVLVAVIGVARVVRLITHDDFPPSVWFRDAVQKIADGSPWGKVAFCLWCATPWIMLLCGGWFALSLTVEWAAWAWWVFWGWMALSYLASLFTYWDEGNPNT